MEGLTYLKPGLTLVCLLLTGGLLAECRGRTKVGRRLIKAGVLLLFFWTWRPAATVFVGTLEWWYPPERLPAKNVQALVVLSAAFYAPNPPQPRTVPGFQTYLRCRHAAWLYQNGWQAPVVVSGGGQGDRVMAEIMREALVKEGVPTERIWFEGQSRSTYENAVYTARMLQPQGIRRIALVTEAYHMARSERLFRRQGFDVEPAPCAYRTLDFDCKLGQWLPDARALEINEDTLHEWVGMVWYAANGRT